MSNRSCPRRLALAVALATLSAVAGAATSNNGLYRLPDHHRILQTYVWQDYDLWPKFPVLQKFLDFWSAKLEGPLHSVTVAHSRLIKPAELRAVDGVFRLH